MNEHFIQIDLRWEDSRLPIHACLDGEETQWEAAASIEDAIDKIKRSYPGCFPVENEVRIVFMNFKRLVNWRMREDWLTTRDRAQ